jgi:hypothetical protein
MLRQNFPSLPSAIDFHRPLSKIGSTLDENQQKEFKYLVLKIKKCIESPSALSYASETLNLLLDEVTYCIIVGGYDELLPELIRFLRVSITSSQLNCVEKATKLCDMLVKNCGSDIHKLVGRRYFMKTMSLVARRQMSKRNSRNLDVGIFLLDTIQVQLTLLVHDTFIGIE